MRNFNVSSSVGKARGLLLAGIIAATILFPTSVGAVTTDTNTGLVTSISSMSDSKFKTVVYCSPDASANGSGTSNSPMTLKAAITLSNSTDGIAIILQSGTYSFNSEIKIAYGNNGSENALKVLKAADGANVTLDFSSQSYSTGARGLSIDGNYWYVYGITIKGAADNGIYLTGSNNVIERCILQGNRDSGLQISRRDSSLTNKEDWPSYNYIINCTAFDNDDPATHENADGFASKLTCGEGNVFDGCISYCNIDDGWDLYAKPETGSIGVVTLRNCIAFNNGTKTDGTSSTNGDRNGFKLGGSNGACPTPHVVYNCMAFNNGKAGFTDNGNGAALTIQNCTSYNNGSSNFNFYRTNGGIYSNLLSVNGKETDKFVGTINNSVYYNGGKYYEVQPDTSVISGQKVGSTVSGPSDSNFVNLSHPNIKSNVDSLFRNSNGTINVNGFLVKNGSSFSGMGAEFGISTRTLNLNVSIGSGSVTVPTTAPPTPPTTAPTIPQTQATSTATETATKEVHSAAQVVDTATIVKSEDVAEILKNTVDEPVVDIVTDKATTLDSSVFSEISGKDKIVKVEIVNSENQMIYSWSFDGKTVNSSNIVPDTILDLLITFEIDTDKQKAIEKLTDNKKALYLSFAQHGVLPGPAIIKTYVGNIYSDGTKLSLNYYNEESNKVELINDTLVVTDGYVEFTITHCSVYFFTQNEMTLSSVVTSTQAVNVLDNGATSSNEVKSGSGLVVVLIIVSILLVAGGVFVFLLKKRKGSKDSDDIVTIDLDMEQKK